MRRKFTQSSLPDSLIPHLYSAPQLSLNDDDDTNNDEQQQQQQQRPIYSDPIFYSSTSIVRLPSITRRGSSLPPPPRLTSPLPLLPRQSQQSQQSHQQQQQQHHPHHQLHQVYHDQPLPPPRTLLRDYEDSYTSSLASLSISAPTSSSSTLHTFPDSPESHNPTVSHTFTTPTDTCNPRDDSKKRKKRKNSPDPDDSLKKSRNPRKTLVACNFCRGRKLRCNGARPACYNCSIRNAKRCEYVPVQRRRGPGRAPRGSRARRNGSGTSRGGQSGSMSDPGIPNGGGSPNISYELESLAPEVRPYTSVMTFDPPTTIFTFRPPTPTPPQQQYSEPVSSSRRISQDLGNHFSFSSAFHSMHHQQGPILPLQRRHVQQQDQEQQEQQAAQQEQRHHLQQQQQHYHNDPYQHIRTPRSRETSSEDQSDIEEFYRRQRYGS